MEKDLLTKALNPIENSKKSEKEDKTLFFYDHRFTGHDYFAAVRIWRMGPSRNKDTTCEIAAFYT